MGYKAVIDGYKKLKRKEIQNRLAHAEVTLSTIASEGRQTDPNYDNPGFQELYCRAQSYFHWVWKRK